MLDRILNCRPERSSPSSTRFNATISRSPTTSGGYAAPRQGRCFIRNKRLEFHSRAGGQGAPLWANYTSSPGRRMVRNSMKTKFFFLTAPSRVSIVAKSSPSVSALAQSRCEVRTKRRFRGRMGFSGNRAMVNVGWRKASKAHRQGKSRPGQGLNAKLTRRHITAWMYRT